MSSRQRNALEERENCENNGKLLKYLRIRKGTKMGKNIFIKLNKIITNTIIRGNFEK